MRRMDRTPALRAAVENLELRTLMSVTTAPAYLVPAAPGVEITPLLTVGDAVPETNGQPGEQYRMVGIPDGMGAYDNGDGTFTALINHELRPDRGVVREHGSAGAFVSKYVIEKATGNVLSGDDLIKSVMLWNPATNAYESGTTAFNRLCSADLPPLTAFYNPATGLGTTERIFMNGEETSNGRAFAHVVSSGVSWELPWMGKYAWENHVASPYAQDKTIAMGLDDSRREFSAEGAAEPSEVYVWVGQKQATGTVIERAGLVDGILHGVRVGTPGAYDADESTVTSGERFELVALEDHTNDPDYKGLQAESIAKSITQFRRVEDGHFDTTDPNVFYYTTTDRFGGQTRVWKLTFDDITRPEAGGKIEIAVDTTLGAPTEGEPLPGEMFDNMTVNYDGDLLLQEDPGGQRYLASIWQYDTSAGDRTKIAQHNPAVFTGPVIDPAKPNIVASRGDIDPFTPGNQGTIDEESSGIIDLAEILGPGYYLANVQAHYELSDPELVEAGQLLLINTNKAAATFAAGVLEVTGTVNDDELVVSRTGQTVSVSFNGTTIGTADAKALREIRVAGLAGADAIAVAANVHVPALLDGGLGEDSLRAGGANSILIGGEGTDTLTGGSREDVVIANAVSLASAQQSSAFSTWSGNGSYAARRESLRSLLADAVTDDGDADVLGGGGSKDLFFGSVIDQTKDRQPGESLN